MCVYCQSHRITRQGFQSGRRRYRCGNCGRRFQYHKRARLNQKLWLEYVWGKQTLKQLAKKYQHSRRWVRQQLDASTVSHFSVPPQPVVIIADSTFVNRTAGYAVIRAPNLKLNLWWQAIKNESAEVYKHGRLDLERAGFRLTAAVVDAKHGTRQVFADLPVQICHFHQAKIVTIYLTNTPNHPAAQELLILAHSLPKLTETKLQQKLRDWYQCWHRVMLLNSRWRSAYRSLKHNLPWLYTYQTYPELNIPNTTNSLEGTFSQMKQKLKNHRGLKPPRRHKLVNELFNYQINT